MNNSPEGKNLGFTHVYMLTFEDAAARDAYLPHPDHAKFGELLGKLASSPTCSSSTTRPAADAGAGHRQRRERRRCTGPRSPNGGVVTW